MFINLEDYTGPSEIHADICIVGAGAAGITLAIECMQRGSLDVCILESGTFDPDSRTQALADGEIVGLPYYPLSASRVRYFGGTTYHWAGVCRPFDPVDFEQRANVPYSGWPITRASLEGFYERAGVYCKRPNEYTPQLWTTPDAPLLPFDESRIETKIMLERAVRFGSEYRESLTTSRQNRIFLGANVTELTTAPNGLSITQVRANSLAGKSLSVRARYVVVAAGAIENARLLLCNTKVHSRGIGNDRDLVGRFFMEHPLVPSMELQLLKRDSNFSLYTGQTRNGLRAVGGLALSAQVMRNDGLLNGWISLTAGTEDERIHKSSPGVLSAVTIWNALKEGEIPPELGKLLLRVVPDTNKLLIYGYERAFLHGTGTMSMEIQLEQAPNPDSRVMLSDKADALGMRKVKLDWRMGELERFSVNRMGQLVAREFGRIGLGRVRLISSDDDGWWFGMRGSWHQMGTTRMHSDPTQGVVNADCRVHGIDNLFLAGSSVFTTAGSANPTLTIVALAIRLADFLKDLK